MKSFLRLLSLIKNYKLNVVLHVLCNIFAAIFTVLSIPATIPLFKIFFGQTETAVARPVEPLGFSNLEEWGKFYLSELVQSAGSQTDALITIILILLALYFLKNVFQYFALFFMAPVRNGIVHDLRQKVYGKLMNLPLSYFSEEKKGDLISRATADVQEIEWSILNVLEKTVREPLLILGSLAFMLYTSAQLTLFVIGLLIVTALLIGFIAKRLKRQSRKVQSTLGQLMAVLDESIFGMKVVKGFNAEERMKEQFRGVSARYRDLLTHLLWRKDLASPLSEFLGIAVVCVLFWYGAQLVFGGELDPGVFLAYLLAFFYILNPAKSFSGAYYNIQKGLAAMERIDQVLDAPLLIESPADAGARVKFEREISFEDVSFRYAGSSIPALTDIHLKIKKGQILALAGSSGAGKTTLADLILRFYDVDEGRIAIDGVDIRQMNIGALRALVGIVTQEPILFNDTIANNIAFGKPEAGREEIERAARIANAHDFIVETTRGYDTVIGDRGTKLSGGQRQRVSIARAVLKDPPILILDEATSALDSESEKLVQDALQKVMTNRTAIVIAHRLSTIQNADSIVVMKDGRIIEKGKHYELLTLDGEYRKFVEMQAF